GAQFSYVYLKGSFSSPPGKICVDYQPMPRTRSSTGRRRASTAPAVNQPELAFEAIKLPPVELKLSFRRVGFLRRILQSGKQFLPVNEQQLPHRRTRRS